MIAEEEGMSSRECALHERGPHERRALQDPMSKLAESALRPANASYRYGLLPKLNAKPFDRLAFVDIRTNECPRRRAAVSLSAPEGQQLSTSVVLC